MTVARPVIFSVDAGGTYDPPVRIVAMAPDRVNISPPSEPTPGGGVGSLELWDRCRSELRAHHSRGNAGFIAGPERSQCARTAPRLVSRGITQKWGQTGYQAPDASRSNVFCALVTLGSRLVRLPVSSPRPRDGRVQLGPAFHPP